MRYKMLFGTGISVLLVLVVVCTSIMAQQKAAAKPAQSPKKDSDQVIGRSDYMKTNWGDKKTVLMKGNVKFTHDDTVLTSDQVEYDEKVKTAVSPGKLVITDPECDITGDKGAAYFKKKLGVIEGNVVMNMCPKKTAEEKADKDSVIASAKDPTMITCKKLEYLYKQKIATAIGGVVFKQDTRTATADKAVYDQKKELLILTGNITYKDDKDQTFTAPGKVTISLKKGDEWIEAPNAISTFKIDLEDEEEE